MEHKLEATNGVRARAEARKFAPCTLKGYDKNGECVYITAVRAPGDKAYVATATKGDYGRPTSFIALTPADVQSCPHCGSTIVERRAS